LEKRGISKIGQLRNFTVLLTATSTGGIFNGVTKYVSEFKNDQEQLQKMFSTAFVFTAIGIAVTSLLLFLQCDFFKTLFVWY
jgi:PST family polysaccharide transporter